MQARLRSDRIHAACLASIPYWKENLETLQKQHEAAIIKKMQPLLLEKTWCGGFKYNEASAREFVEGCLFDPVYYRFRMYWARKLEKANEALACVKRLAEKTSQTTKPFPILLSEYEYGLIWDEV